jgi:hypothetical protein
MKFRVAIPLLAICLASPAISSGEQAKKGRGYSPRGGGGTQTAERSGGDNNRGGSDRERTATANNRPEEGRAETRTAERREEPRAREDNRAEERRTETRTADTAPEPQRYAVPRDNGGNHVVNRPPDSRTVIVTRNRPGNSYNNGSYYRGPRYYAPAHYDYWARRYYRWSPISYAPWSLIYGSIGYANFGFYGGIGPSPYPLGPFNYGYNGYGYGPGAYPYSPWQASGYDIGGVRLKIRPRDAQVFVDGYYTGLVDDFDGTFQSLRLEAGGHKIEIRMPGFQDFELDVHVQPGRTITLNEDLRPRP